jgi:hypothetical protein
VVHMYLCMFLSMLCVYVSMVCQRCMLYDDMYLHDNCHDHMCVSYSIECVMVVSSAYLRFLGLGLEDNDSSGRTHPHVVSGGIV